MANRFSKLLQKFGLALGADGGESPLQDGGLRVSKDAEYKSDSVSRVYAQALLELSQADGQTDAIAQEAAELLSMLGSNEDLDRLLSNRALNTSQRKDVVEKLFKGNVSDVFYRFLQVVNQKGRLDVLGGILQGFVELTAEARGEMDVDVYVAESLSDSAGQGVSTAIGTALNKKVRLREHVDPELIGGLKVRVGDRLIDGSVATQLRIIKRRLVEAGRESARAGGLLENE